jgi:nitrogen fixation/metabolism regulation signal transduction histidine kinase
MSTSEQQMQQLVDQVQMLTAELAAQRLELDAAKNALDQQTQTATAALSVAQAAIAQMGKTETQKKTLNPKLVNPPDPFQGTDADWERYKFGFATWISTVDPTYPDLLRKAELERDEVATVEMTEADEQLSTNLFVREQGCWHTFLLGPQGLKVNCIDFHATM